MRPAPSSAPGLSPEGLAGFETLVDAHLEGPGAAIALESFHAAVDQYFALAVPEPSALVLAASLLPLLPRRIRDRSQEEKTGREVAKGFGRVSRFQSGKTRFAELSAISFQPSARQKKGDAAAV
jgi:hypothetical protein